MSNATNATDKQTVANLLRMAGPRGVTTNELLAAVGPRYSARIFDLRDDDGWLIDTTRLGASQSRYRLVSESARSGHPDNPSSGCGHAAPTAQTSARPGAPSAPLPLGEAPAAQTPLFDVTTVHVTRSPYDVAA